MRLKVIRERTGIFRKPSREIWVSEQGIPCTHGWTFSGMIPAARSTWNKAMSQPTPASGPAYRTTRGSNGKRPIARISTIGYMVMRWYQHNSHTGTSMTSLKKRLARVAILTTTQVANTSDQPGCKACGAFVLFTPVVLIIFCNNTHLIVGTLPTVLPIASVESQIRAAAIWLGILLCVWHRFTR